MEAIFCFLAEARAAAGREVNSGNTVEGCKALKVERETPGWEDCAPTDQAPQKGTGDVDGQWQRVGHQQEEEERPEGIGTI